MYDENAPKLAGLGYFPIPVAPANATYVAKKSPVVFNVWENRYVNLAEWSTMAAPVTAPQPGANIGVRAVATALWHSTTTRQRRGTDYIGSLSGYSGQQRGPEGLDSVLSR